MNDGARPIMKIIKDEIENPLAELLMQGDLASANLTTVSYYKTKQEVKFSIKE